MVQCSKTTNVYGVLGLLKGQGGRCSRRATYTDDAGNLFCKQHAKIEATAAAPAQNRIRPDCRPIDEKVTNNPTQVEAVEGLAGALDMQIAMVEQDRDDDIAHAWATGERPDLHDYVVEVPLATARMIATALRSSTVNDELVAMLVADPVDVSAGIPEHLIEVGMAVLDRVDEDNRNYVSGETTDWDTGMVAAAVFKAMLRAALAKINGGEG